MIIIVKLNFHFYSISVYGDESNSHYIEHSPLSAAHHNWRTGPFLLYNSIQMTFEGWINHYVRSKELEGL